MANDNSELMQLMQKKQKEKGQMDPNKKAAKMAVLHELKGMMSAHMGKELPDVAKMKADSQSGGLDAARAKMPGDGANGTYDSNDQHKDAVHLMGAKVTADSPEHLKEGLQTAAGMTGKIPTPTLAARKGGDVTDEDAKHNMNPDVNDTDHTLLDQIGDDHDEQEEDAPHNIPPTDVHPSDVTHESGDDETEESLAAQIKKLESKRKNLAMKKTYRF